MLLPSHPLQTIMRSSTQAPQAPSSLPPTPNDFLHSRDRSPMAQPSSQPTALPCSQLFKANFPCHHSFLLQPKLHLSSMTFALVPSFLSRNYAMMTASPSFPNMMSKLLKIILSSFLALVFPMVFGPFRSPKPFHTKPMASYVWTKLNANLQCTTTPPSAAQSLLLSSVLFAKVTSLHSLVSRPT